jgi:hypothetical protein
MSKMDALRAMREARYEKAAAQASKGPAKPANRPKAQSVTSATVDDAEGLCGHRSMNGRTCTREHGHAARSHRYS